MNSSLFIHSSWFMDEVFVCEQRMEFMTMKNIQIFHDFKMYKNFDDKWWWWGWIGEGRWGWNNKSNFECSRIVKSLYSSIRDEVVTHSAFTLLRGFFRIFFSTILRKSKSLAFLISLNHVTFILASLQLEDFILLFQLNVWYMKGEFNLSDIKSCGSEKLFFCQNVTFVKS